MYVYTVYGLGKLNLSRSMEIKTKGTRFRMVKDVRMACLVLGGRCHTYNILGDLRVSILMHNPKRKKSEVFLYPPNKLLGGLLVTHFSLSAVYFKAPVK